MTALRLENYRNKKVTIHLCVSDGCLHEGVVVIYGNNGLITSKEADLALPSPMERGTTMNLVIPHAYSNYTYDTGALCTTRHQFNEPHMATLRWGFRPGHPLGEGDQGPNPITHQPCPMPSAISTMDCSCQSS